MERNGSFQRRQPAVVDTSAPSWSLVMVKLYRLMWFILACLSLSITVATVQKPGEVTEAMVSAPSR
jgi:hypothetical protein